MVVYCLGGLGADERVFKYIHLDAQMIFIPWVNSNQGEGLFDYARRLTKQINTKEKFGILGVSFGGIVATEIAKMINPSFAILISSASVEKELNNAGLQRTPTWLIKALSNYIVQPPKFVTNYMFAAQNKELLQDILDDTNMDFAKWAMIEMSKWRNTEPYKNTYQIHGTADRIIKMGKRDCFEIEKGSHFMVVDRADEISQIINKQILTSEIEETHSK